MKKLVVLMVAGLIICGASWKTASAIPAFSTESALYNLKTPSTPEEKALKEAVDKVKCNVCHEGTNKKMRNAYGQALDALLDKAKDGKDTAKIRAALQTVEKEDAGDGQTFGDRIKAGKLPVGE